MSTKMQAKSGKHLGGVVLPYVLVRRVVGIKRIAPILLAAVSITASALAQETARPDKGVRSGASYAVSDIENVNMTNGNVNLSIPLASLPPIAGGKLSWTIAANYNSKLWDVHSEEEEDISTVPFTRFLTKHLQPNGGGWTIGGRYRIQVSESREDVNWKDPLCDAANEPPQYCDPDFQLLEQHPAWFKVELITPDGTVHELRPLSGVEYPGTTRPYLFRYYRTTPATTGTTMSYYSYDGSYLWAAIQPWDPFVSGLVPPNWDVYMNDGMRIKNRGGDQWIIDTNGNSIRIFSMTSGDVTTTHFVDQQTMREIKLLFDQGVNPPHGQYRVEYQTVGGVWMTIEINLRATSVEGWAYLVNDTQFCSDRAELITHAGLVELVVIDSIVLPATEPGLARQFEFDYNSDEILTTSYVYRPVCNLPPQEVTSISRGLGSLSRMKTPSGAEVQYSYNLDIPPPEPNQPAVAGVLEAIEFPREAITEKRLIHDNTTDVWTYNVAEGGSSMNSPDGSFVSEQRYPRDPALQWTSGGLDGKGGLTYKTVQSNLVKIERQWKLNSLNGSAQGSTGSGGLVPFNPVVDIEFTTLLDPPGSPAKMTAKKFTYDFNGNVTSEIQYDWFPLTPAQLADPSNPDLQPDAQGVPTQIPSSAVIVRVTNNNYYNDATTQTSLNVYNKRIDPDPNDETPPSPLIINAPRSVITIPSQTEFHYDGLENTPPTKGNLTKQRRWEGTKWIQTTHTYDSLTGNLTSTTDPNNNVTQFFYDDLTKALPTRVVVDPLNGTGTQTTTTVYDFPTGLVTSVTDPNGKTTDTDYTNQLLLSVDPFGRPGKVTAPAVTSVVDGVETPNQRREVITKYFDSTLKVELASDLNTQGDGNLKIRTSSDQLGRVILTETSEDGVGFSISAQTVYKQMGRITFASNPRRPAGAPTDGWARTTRDNLGRVVEVASFSGVGLPPDSGTNTNWTGSVTSAYVANQTTVADQAAKSRSSEVDGLGRLVKVVEDPGGDGFETTYQYDSLGNLTRVNQGSQQRDFTYDSLSRLISAENPEQVNGSGVKVATTYEYDDASNLKKKTNPNGTIIDFTFDGLNRVKTKTLSVGGAFTYAYDTGTNGKGRLASVTLVGGDGYYYDGYDAMGRVTASSQKTTAGSQQTYSMSYGYDLTGNMTKEVYPSGRAITISYDDAGRLDGLSGTKDAQVRQYVTSASYTAHGAISSMALGNGLTETSVFNSRLQPTAITLSSVATGTVFDLSYKYGVLVGGNLDATKNNGNVQSQEIKISATTIKQSYLYDALNRISSAEEALDGTSRWTQAYEFDRFGNRTLLTNTGADAGLLPTQSTPGVDGGTNRLVGFSYDTSGNVLGDGVGNTFTYDAENRQATHTRGGATTSYTYDGEGHRVKKEGSGVTTIFVYNAESQLIAEYVTPDQPVEGGGGTSYLTTDHLGSTRLVTDLNKAVKSRRDYCPYGEELGGGIAGRTTGMGYGQADGLRQKFTQKERDAESSLDYFGTRYYYPSAGRFTSPDPFGPWAMSDEEKDDFYVTPQQWNLYVYVIGNPLRYIDPEGSEVYDPNVTEEQREKIHAALVRISIYGNEEQQAGAEFILNNDVLIRVVQGISGGATTGVPDSDAANNAIAQRVLSPGEAASFIRISINLADINVSTPKAMAWLEARLVHEGEHVVSIAATISTLSDRNARVFEKTKYREEYDAFKSQAEYLLSRGGPYTKIGLRHRGDYVLTRDRSGNIRINEAKIRETLRTHPLYLVTPRNPGPKTAQRHGLKKPR